MLPRSERIPKGLFADLEKSRQAVSSPHFTLRFAPGAETRARSAAVTSKKVSKSAVVRNAVRRRVYSALKSSVPKLKPGLYLFVTKKGVDKLRGEKLVAELSSLLKGFERG